MVSLENPEAPYIVPLRKLFFPYAARGLELSVAQLNNSSGKEVGICHCAPESLGQRHKTFTSA